MKKDECFFLGSITKLFGFKGEVVIFIDSDEPEKYDNLDAVFIEFGGKLIPYFIERTDLRNKSNQLTVKFQDIDNEEQAQQLLGRELYLPLSLLPPLTGDAFYFYEIEGFSVIDHTKGPIGTINQVLDYPGNPLFEIEFQGKQILIPVKDEFIERTDRKNRTIYLKAPQGLIDIYLNEP
ncbi:MAG: ribosome maturation factor RimM [Bacteroidales bacterium]|nr:ribosome maturation factor RimM [Bacteroidales bacterium]